jgi:predicted RNA-binding Zn-ribbon protein involved in translation (DUF1610 family)
MPDLISLICPSCGGRLQVSPKATSLTCQHCGNEHLVKHEAGGVTLEAYARCPECGRNDKSEKVTAVIGSQSQEISGMEQKNEVIVDGQGKQQVVTHTVPFTRKQISVLGQRLAPPEEPQFETGLQSQGFIPSEGGSSSGGILAIICGAVLLIVSVVIGLVVLVGIYNLFTSPGNQIQDIAMMAIIGLVSGLISFLVGTAAIAFGIYLVIRSSRKKRTQLADYQRKVEDEFAERQHIQSAWKTAIERWNLLYYCGRDDCVFIPGEHTSAPTSKMKEYLYQ